MESSENIYSLKGLSKVFKFTLVQTFKNKAYIISFVLFVVIMTFMGPLQYVMGKTSEDTAKKIFVTDLKDVSVKNVYIVNKTLVELKINDYSGIHFEVSDKTYDELALNLGKKDAIIVIKREINGFDVSGVIADDSDIPANEINDVTEYVRNSFELTRNKTLNVSDKEVKKISSGVNIGEIISESDYVAEKMKTVSGSKYFTYVLAFSVIIMMVVSLSNSFIIASVTEEKQSKLAESILTSVRPMALLMGKILGMMSYVILILLTGFVGSRISDFVMDRIMNIDRQSYSATGFDFTLFNDFGVRGVIILFFSMIIGYLTFGVLGGIFGSACVKTEDIQSATGSVMTMVMIGYAGAIFAAVADMHMVSVVLSVLPPFSYFTAPIMYLTGRIGILQLILSISIQMIIVFFLVFISARTYKVMLLSDTSTPKLRSILSFAGKQ